MQLKDLSIENRRYALNIKADMTDDNRLEVLKTNDYKSTIKGIHALLVSEPNFFLVSFIVSFLVSFLVSIILFLCFYLKNSI